MNKTLQTGGGGAGYFVFAPGIAKGRIKKKTWVLVFHLAKLLRMFGWTLRKRTIKHF
jgi:hypothetical protein